MNIKQFFQSIEQYGVTSILLPPSAIRMILMLTKDKLAEYAGQIDHIHTGSAAFPEADKEKLCELLPHSKLYFAYGSSEAGCVSLYDYSKNRGLISCVGKPNKNAHIIIVDQNRKEIKSSKDCAGLIAIAGSMNMQGYYDEPELTEAIMYGDYLYTNDLGYYDENGFLYMIGRQDDVINIGGLKIAPTEIEDVALRFAGLAECACFAIGDRMGGSIPKLAVIMEKGAVFDAGAIQRFLGEYLEAFKVPKRIEEVGVIPRTANGKVDRKKLS